PLALDGIDVAVRGALEAFVEAELVRTVDDHEPLRARLFERGYGFLRGEMSAEVRLARADLGERRLAQEEVRAAGELGGRIARRGVARVRERALAVGDPKAVRLDVVMGHAHRRHAEAVDRERLASAVLVELERLLEHAVAPEVLAEAGELAGSGRRDPELGTGHRPAGAVLGSPAPGDDIAPVIEVEVGDHDRVHVRPPLLP